VAWTDCLALLLYLTRLSDLDAAVETYRSASQRLTRVPQLSTASAYYLNDLLHQSRARLLHRHVIASRAYKPAGIRTLLQESISLFPHNTMFLSLFAWNESRFRIDERVRDVLRDVTQQDKYPTDQQPVPITSHIFAVIHELHRPVYSGSTQYSVRAAFERAIGDPAFSTSGRSIPVGTDSNAYNTGRSNLSLWKLYILFELSRNDVSRAKEVFYRGMRACPWSKDLLMVAFHNFQREERMGFHELRRVYNVLVDKELRIHAEIDEEMFDEAERIVRARASHTAADESNHMNNKSGKQGQGNSSNPRDRTLPINLPSDKDSDSES
jgi:hypothetical protein